MLREKLWIGMAVIGSALTIGLSGCGKGDSASAAKAPERPPAMVKAVAAELRDVPVYLDEIGKVVSMDTVSVIPQVGGKVMAAHVEDGADVKKGQLLFEIDPRPFEAALASAKAALAQSKAELDWAGIEFRRVKPLEGTSAISQQEIDQKKNAIEVAEAKLQASEAAVEIVKLNLEYTKIYSPIDGRAGARLIVPGNVVKANDLPLLNIQRLNPIYAEFNVTENDLGTVRKFLAARNLLVGLSPEKGLKVEVDLPGDSATVLTALGKPATQPAGPSSAGTAGLPTTQPRGSGPRVGTMTFLDNAVQAGSGTIRVRATLPNTDYYFWPGQFVNCRLILTTKRAALLIPLRAQQIGQMGPFVYVIKPDNTAELRPITTGQRQGDLLVVETGLGAGEKVITEGQMMVAPGGNVMVIPSAPPPGAVSQAK